MGWATFWAIFSNTRLVTLTMDYKNRREKKLKTNTVNGVFYRICGICVCPSSARLISARLDHYIPMYLPYVRSLAQQ
jgi:hypothetical protein